MAFIQLLFLAAIVVTSHGSEDLLIRIPDEIHLLRPQSGAAGRHVHGVSCLSWRLGVETNNIIGWKSIPRECEGYVGHYMLGKQYREDSKIVAEQAYLYAKNLTLTRDGKDVWVFDVDETTLSNLPYYEEHGFGVEPPNITTLKQWWLRAKGPALPESVGLYRKLLSLGIKAIFLTGRGEDLRNATSTNLKEAGYHSWEKLILKNSTIYPRGTSAVFYKSSERAKLEKLGYRIVGNMGDQWGDLLGNNTGARTFKLPDPMYYLS